MYAVFKILHIVAFTSWMAGLFYLPRLFVYHCGASYGSDMDKTFRVMEHKLYYYIMWPAMVAALLSGVCMLFIKYIGDDLTDFQLWGWVKLLCVALLVGYHIRLNTYRLRFVTNTNVYSHRFYRLLNEVPTLIFIVIVISVVIKFT